PLELNDFRGRRIDPEIKRQLTVTRCQQRAKHGAKAGSHGQLGFGLSNHGKIGEGVERLPVRTMRRMDEPPFLHVTKTVLTEVLATFEHLSARNRSGCGSGSAHAPPI